MANQKAEIHTIELQTQNIDLNQYKGNIQPYDGFSKYNSPYYGNILSPFYAKKYKGLGKNTYVANDGTIYSLVDGKFTLTTNNQTTTLTDNTTKFLTKKEVMVSGNTTYSNIIGFFQTVDGHKMLCTSNEGKLAIVNSDTTLYAEFNVTTYPNEKIHFTEYNPTANSYCFAIGTALYYVSANKVISNIGSPTDRTIEYSFGCIVQGAHFIICRYNNYTNRSNIYTTTDGSSPFTQVNRIVINGSAVSNTDWPCFFNRDKKMMWFSAGIVIGNNIPIITKSLSITSSTSLSTVIKTYISKGVTTTDLLWKNFGNTSNIAIIGIGNNSSYTVYHPEVWGKKSVPRTIKWPVIKWLDYGTDLTYVDKVVYDEVDAVIQEAYTETFYKNNYSIALYDTTTETGYNNVPIGGNNNYLGGYYVDMGNNVRALYHGDTLQGLSMARDSITVGTMLCTMSEIDENYPITVSEQGNTTYIYYKDSSAWNYIRATSNTDEATLKVINEQYILLNTVDYYNCFDTNSGKWYHFGSDWNDRAVFTSSTEADGLANIDQYKSNQESWYFVSAQGANYENLGTPFIATIFPAYAAYFSKKAQNMQCHLLAGATPNDQDIDIYYGKNSEYGNAPLYRYSVDYNSNTTVKYANNKLENTNYAFSFTIIPSIFARFIDGFINQGIVVDNNHSYLQIYVNNTKPIFAVNFQSQLEGITSAFIIQGQYFVVIDNCIYKYVDGQTTAIVNVGDMEFIGNNPYIALFWSSTNRTIYRFAGDNNITPISQANEISRIVYTSFNPNTLSIYVITDKCVLIYGQDTLIRLPYTQYNSCFPLKDGVALSGEGETMEISYNPKEGFDILPIDIETELYGYGNSIKAVNDTVYIRLVRNGTLSEGVVTVQSETLNEGMTASESKDFNINKFMWDKNSGTIFLRYQPKAQAATGFRVRIKSPFAIATLQIGSTVETIQNSKYNI